MTPAPTFHAYVYSVADDRDEWRGYTRESLLDEVVLSAFAYHGRSARVVFLREASVLGVWLADHQRIRDAWRNWWRVHGQSVRLAHLLGIDQVRNIRGDTLTSLIEAASPPSGAVGAP